MSKVFSTLRRTFLAGMLVVLPLGITLWVVVSLASLVDSVLDILPPALHPEQILGIQLPGLGILLAVTVVFLVGAGMRYYTGRALIELFERLILQVPVLSGVYGGVKKLFDTMFATDNQRFRQVVMVEYPRRDAWALAFLTGDAPYLETGIPELGGDAPVSIFLPTTPNPTSGFYLVLPRKDVRLVDMSVEEAFKLIMSAGIVHPERITSVLRMQSSAEDLERSLNERLPAPRTFPDTPGLAETVDYEPGEPEDDIKEAAGKG